MKKNNICARNNPPRDIFEWRTFASFSQTSIVPAFTSDFHDILPAQHGVYNIWNFLRNLAATLVINITFRRANRADDDGRRDSIRIHAGRTYIRLYDPPGAEKFANMHHRVGEKSQGIRRRGDDIARGSVSPGEYAVA